MGIQQFPAPNNSDVYYIGRRNLLHNGAMQIHQRGTGPATNTGAAAPVTADRWNIYADFAASSITVENDGPTGSGFRKSFKWAITTGASGGTSGQMVLAQKVEGQNLQAIRKGTSSAQPLVASFWVKSNAPGQYTLLLSDSDNSRSISTPYTINSSGVWEFKTLYIPADTTGQFDNDANSSLSVAFGLGYGTNYTSGTLNTSWNTDVTANRYVGQTNLGASTGNYWQITGVQLEVGPVATPYDFRPYDEELATCQRYYEMSYNIGVTPGTATEVGNGGFYGASDGASYLNAHIPFRVTKRDTPSTVSTWAPNGTSGQWYYQRSGIAAANTATTVARSGANGFDVYINAGATWVPCWMFGHWAASADL